jgi:hypothetical protein
MKISSSDLLKGKVVSLELSKALSNSGYSGTSHFWHIAGCIMAFPETTLGQYEAPLVSEILEELPIAVTQSGVLLELRIKKWARIRGDVWSVQYISPSEQSSQKILIEHSALHLADAAAKTWLWLKEEGLV